jgi:hypothetical protein
MFWAGVWTVEVTPKYWLVWGVRGVLGTSESSPQASESIRMSLTPSKEGASEKAFFLLFLSSTMLTGCWKSDYDASFQSLTTH